MNKTLPLVALLLLVGCERARIVTPECFGGDPSTQSGRAVLWDGYGYQWQDISHRVSFLRAGTGIPDDDGAFDAQMGILGGDWADGRAYRDTPHFANGHSILEAEGAGLVAHYGEVEVVVGADGPAVTEVVLDLDDIGLPERGSYLVGLRGVCFNSDVPLEGGYSSYDSFNGWTPQALGASVSPAELSGRTLTFTTELRFEAGVLDRDDVNAAIPYLRLGGAVRYVVLALDTVSVDRASLDLATYYRAQGEVHTYIPGIPPEALTAPVDADPGGALAFPLLRGWRHVLNEESEPESRGRYLRAWTARLAEFDYSSEEGGGSVTLDMYMSSSSIIQEGDMEVKHGADFDFVVLGDDGATLDRGLVVQEMPTLGNFDHPVDAGASAE